MVLIQKITVTCQPLFRMLIRNRVHVVACSAAAAWSWARLTDTVLLKADLLVVSLLILCIYEWNRIFDIPEDRINSPEAASFSSRFEPGIRTFCGFGTLFCFISATATGNPKAAYPLLIVALLGFFYSCPLPFKKALGNKRLKDLTIIKNITSALGWSILVVLYPAIHGGAVLTAPHWLAAGLVFAAVWMVELVWDIRDIRGDRESGVYTVAVRQGIRGAVLWIGVINTLMLVGLVAAVGFKIVPVYWLLILFSNFLIYSWVVKGETALACRARSHLLVGLQTLLLICLGWLAGSSELWKSFNVY